MFVVISGSQFGFYHEIDLKLHQFTEHFVGEHRTENEAIHSDNDMQHHEETETDKSEDNNAKTHDHSDELNFYSSHSQFVLQYHEAPFFLKSLPNFSGHFLLTPITYDYIKRISRPPCLV